jgi:hypothetical protein
VASGEPAPDSRAGEEVPDLRRRVSRTRILIAGGALAAATALLYYLFSF